MMYVESLVKTMKRRLLKLVMFAWLPETAVSSELADGVLVPIGDETWCAPLTIAALANPAMFDAQTRALWDLL